jgi:hypothetical protein
MNLSLDSETPCKIDKKIKFHEQFNFEVPYLANPSEIQDEIGKWKLFFLKLSIQKIPEMIYIK